MKGLDLYARVRHLVMVEGMSRREAARLFGINRRTIDKMLRFSVPPGYRRKQPVERPKLDAFVGIIEAILEATNEKRLLKLQKQLARFHLLIVDELGYVPLSASGSELLFEVFSRRYECGSIIVTSNLPFDEWTSIFGSERLTGALLDRLTHHVHILEMNGDSYRLASARKARKAWQDGTGTQGYAQHWIVIAAITSSHGPGFVECIATRGGSARACCRGTAFPHSGDRMSGRPVRVRDRRARHRSWAPPV